MRRRTTAIAAIAVAAVLVVFVVLLAASDTERTSSINFEIVGKVAPPIDGETLDGTTFSLRDHRGDWVVVNFFASWCVGCRVEHPELVDFTERHADDGVQLVSVMFGDTEADAKAFFDELGGSWPTLLNGTRDVILDYGVTAVPETLLVAPTGRVVQKWVNASGVTADQIDNAIERFESNG